MYLEPIQYLLGLVSGGLVGFTLGLFGGGGSILAVALIVFLVGVSNPRVAIGTSALLGSTLGKMLDGQKLLFLFALLMMAVSLLMFRGRGSAGNPDAACTIANAPKTIGFGAATGALSGFFGIGGGFLIVPGLVASTGMPLLTAIGSSLVAVTAFGLTTTLNYAWSGLVDWPLAAVFVAGGVGGGVIG